MEDFRSLFLLTKAFGYNARSFRQSGPTRIITADGWSRTGLALFFLNGATFVYFAAQNSQLRHSAGSTYVDSGSQLLDLGGLLMLQTSYVTLLLTLVSRMARQRLMARIVDQFARIDRQICVELGVSVDYARELHLAMVILGSFTAVVLLAVCNGFFALYLLDSLRDGMIFYGGQIFVSFSGMVLANNTFTMIFLLYRRVCMVKNFLKTTLNTLEMRPGLILPSSRAAIRPKESLHMKISAIALIYDDLYKQSVNISQLTWTEITSYCGVVVTYGIMTLFATYRALRTGHYESIVISWIYLVWWAEYCAGALLVLAMGHVLALASSQTVELLGEAVTMRACEGMVGIKIRSLMLFISRYAPKITTWFFDVNLTVFFNMMGTMATFLFMMIQFDGQ